MAKIVRSEPLSEMTMVRGRPKPEGYTIINNTGEGPIVVVFQDGTQKTIPSHRRAQVGYVTQRVFVSVRLLPRTKKETMRQKWRST